MAITPEMRKRAEAIPVREKRRLRRNYIMWEGRLKRLQDALAFELSLPKTSKDGDEMVQNPEVIADYRERAIPLAKEKLAKATKEINDALGGAA